MQLLPAVKLLGIYDHQQFRRFPIHLHISLDIVGIPAIQHLEQDLINLLGIRLGNVGISSERIKFPSVPLLAHNCRTENKGKKCQKSDEELEAFWKTSTTV